MASARAVGLAIPSSPARTDVFISRLATKQELSEWGGTVNGGVALLTMLALPFMVQLPGRLAVHSQEIG